MDMFLKMLLGNMGATVNEDGSTGAGGASQQRKSAQMKNPKGTAFTRILISLLVTVVFGAVYFYIKVPALMSITVGYIGLFSGCCWYFRRA